MNVSENASAFKLAICNGNLTDVRKILASACENGEEESLLRAVHGQYQETALLLAVRHGHEEIVKLLLERLEVDVNAADSHECTALHVAASEPDAQNNSNGIIRLLLSQRDIAVDKEEKHGNTPLKLAAEKGNITAVKMLLNKNADITKADKARNTAVHVAAKKGHFEVLLLLLSGGKNRLIIGKQNKNKDTPLHLAAEKGCKRTVAVLLHYGADTTITTENEQKQTPADLAAANQEVLALLGDPSTARRIFESVIRQREQVFADSGYQSSETSQVGENSVMSTGSNALPDRRTLQLNIEKLEHNTYVLNGGIAAVGLNPRVILHGSESVTVSEPAPTLAESSFKVQVSSGGVASIGDYSVANVGAMSPSSSSSSSSGSGSPSSAGSSSGGEDPFTYDPVQMAQQRGSEVKGTTRSIEPRSGSHRAEHDNNSSHVQTSASTKRSISATAGTPGCAGSSIPFVRAAPLKTAHPPGSVSAKRAEFTVDDVSATTSGHPSASRHLQTSSTPKTSYHGVSINCPENSEFKVPLAVNDVRAAASGDPGTSRHLEMYDMSKTSNQATQTKSRENSTSPLPIAVNFTAEATNPEGFEIKGNSCSSKVNTGTSVLALESSLLKRTTGPIDASLTTESSAGIQDVIRTGRSSLANSRSPETSGNSRAPLHPETRTSKELPAHSGTVKSLIGTATDNKKLVGPNCPDGPFGAVGSMETSRPPGSMNPIENVSYGGTAQEEGFGSVRAIKSHKNTYSGAPDCTEMLAQGVTEMFNPVQTSPPTRVNDSAPRRGVPKGDAYPALGSETAAIGKTARSPGAVDPTGSSSRMARRNHTGNCSTETVNVIHTDRFESQGALAHVGALNLPTIRAGPNAFDTDCTRKESNNVVASRHSVESMPSNKQEKERQFLHSDDAIPKQNINRIVQPVDPGLTHRVPLTVSPGHVSQLYTIHQGLESGAQTSINRSTIDQYAGVNDRNPPNGCSRRSDESLTSGYSNSSESNIKLYLSEEDCGASGGDLTQPLLRDSSLSISNERVVLRVNPPHDGDSTNQSQIDNIVNEDPSRDLKGQKGCNRCCIT